MKFNLFKKNKEQIDRNVGKVVVDEKTGENGDFILKTLGVVGAGVAANFLFSKQAKAMTMGSARVTDVSALKDSNDVQLNPATEDTLVQVKDDTADIVTETATLGTNTTNFATNIAPLITNTANILPKKQSNMANSTPIAIASDQTVNVFGEMKFDTSTVMVANAADPLFYLRKIVKQLEPRATMDASKRQRITIDNSNNLVITTTTVFSTIAGYDQRMWQYSSRNAFAVGIRRRLKFS